MIKIIDQPKFPLAKDPQKVRVRCHVCKTLFECDENNMLTTVVAHGIVDDTAVMCPICGNICTSWQEVDQFTVLES